VRHVSLALLAGLIGAGVGGAGDWPGFRGPGGGGVSEDRGLPVKWGKEDGQRWRVELPGRGLSAPVIADGRVYVTACSGYREGRLHVLCFAAADGKKLWERQFASTGNTGCHPKTCMAAPTPVSDGQAVYALFATGDLAALDRDGDLLWYRSLVGDYPNLTNQVGMAASPALAGDVLLLPMENAGDSFRAGIDRKTGRNLWRVPAPRDINWVSPIVIGQGKDAVAVFSTEGEAVGCDPADGRVRWRLKKEGSAQLASPVAGGGLLFVPGRDFRAVRPGPDGVTPEVLWRTARLQVGYASPVFYQGRIYALTPVGITCLDANTGEVVWEPMRIKGPFAASPVLADGKIYVVNEEGVTTVVRLGDRPEVLARNDLGETILATPAIADGALFLRSDRHLWCIGEKKK
jgi:outer membrane protein assembly factor BamB